MKVLVLGDTHGNTRVAVQAVSDAVAHGAQHIVQVGDFGFWPHERDGVEFLDILNARARAMNVQFVWLDGNHENFNALEGMVGNVATTDKGFSCIRSHILYSPRGNSWTWANKRFMTVGGAVSVDKGWRIKEEQWGSKDAMGRHRPPRGVGTLWWPQETISDEDVDFAIAEAAAKPVDYLFTHECSDQTPFRYRLKADPDSKDNRRKMDKILDSVAPDWHFHGHMHTRYDWDRPVNDPNDWTGKWIKTRGLERDGQWYNWGILDTEKDEFLFRGQDKYEPFMEQMGEHRAWEL